MPVTKRQVEQAFEDHQRTYGGLKEDYFGLLYLADYWERKPEQVARQVSFGGDDYGIDGFWIDRDGKALYLYQFKWTTDPAQFKVSLERFVEDGVARIFGNLPPDQRKNPFLVELASRLHEAQSLIEKVFVYFVFDGDTEAAERSKVLESLREDLESKKHFLDSFFERNVTLSFQFQSNRGGRSIPTPQRKTYRFEVAFEDVLKTENGSGEELHVGFLPLAELYGMYKEMGPRLLSRNIRFGLSAENNPNRMLRQAFRRIIIDEIDPPSVFAFNHNGVTLSAEHVAFADGRCTLTEPRVLNGAQTLSSLVKFREDNKENPALEKGRSRFEDILVLAKIITVAKDDFVVGVTVCNNRQNPVAPWNLRASDRIQLELHDKFLKDLGIYYERQEGAFESLSGDELEDLGVEELSKSLQIRRLAQTFLAIQGEVDRMSRMTDVFEQEKMYADTFRESYLRSDARKVLLAYKIQLHLGSIVREMVGGHAQKFDYFRKGRNLVWALLVQAVFNGPQFEKWLEEYGTSLVMQIDYSVALKQLASSRVWSLMKDALSTTEVEQQIAAGKYGVLRTKAAYKRCMDLGYEKFDWTKKTI